MKLVWFTCICTDVGLVWLWASPWGLGGYWREVSSPIGGWYVVLVDLGQYKLLVQVLDKDTSLVLLSVCLYTGSGTGSTGILLILPLIQVLSIRSLFNRIIVISIIQVELVVWIIWFVPLVVYQSRFRFFESGSDFVSLDLSVSVQHVSQLTSHFRFQIFRCGTRVHFSLFRR